MFLLTIFVNLLFVYSATAEWTSNSTEWIQCFNKTCPISNLKFITSLNVLCMIDNPSCYIAHGLDLMDQFDNKFYFDVTSYPYNLTMNQNIGIDLTRDASDVVYTCSDPCETIIDMNKTHPEINGTDLYIKGQKYCSWSLDINNSSFPYDLIDPPQYYISDRGYQIYYNLTQTVTVPAANYSQLPKSVEPFVDGYQYKAVGSEKYLLVARVGNKSADFLLKVNEEAPRLVSVNLMNDISLDIECNFEERIVVAYSKHGQASFNIFKQVHDVKIGGNECRWSLPDSLDSNYGIVNPKQTVYELQITENDRFVYFDEANFRLEAPTPASSSSALTLAKSMLIFVLISVIFS
uniref:Uncharacterized protein n=1 Tax=Tetranychus urticae TaxID=32264 RepID=T1KTY7_TETUR